MAVRRGVGAVVDKAIGDGILRWHLSRDLKERRHDIHAALWGRAYLSRGQCKGEIGKSLACLKNSRKGSIIGWSEQGSPRI